MSKIDIKWKPGITKIENIVLDDIEALDEKGFYLLLGGLPYASKITYERIEPIFVGVSFNQTIREALVGYPDKNESIKRFLDAHYKMDLLFVCGILEQPSSEAISPDNIQKIKQKLIEQIRPACNDIPSEINTEIEIEHGGMFNPIDNRTGRI
ncbi:MAG: hypothetical protein U5J95_09220 [Balneolaceae bacterium]|nr:hypothetical protein [Balneolaceae bacterium]